MGGGIEVVGRDNGMYEWGMNESNDVWRLPKIWSIELKGAKMIFLQTISI